MQFVGEIADFLKKHPLARVATVSADNRPNISLKGIVDVEPQAGVIYFLDLYRGHTFNNLKNNKNIAVEIVDYDSFSGYQFKGTAELIDSGELFEKHSLNWHTDKHMRFAKRHRSVAKLFNNVPDFSELDLPEPKNLVKVTVSEVIGLMPQAKK